jgi:hypothetical protein
MVIGKQQSNKLCKFFKINNKLNIICDTNIWYDIANNYVTEIEMSNLNLHGTFINLFELSTTPNLLNKLPLVQRAVECLHKYHKGIYEIHPFEYLILKQHKNYICIDNRYKSILNSFETLMKADVSSTIDDKYFLNMKIAIEDYKTRIKNITDSINDFLPEIRENIKNSTGKEEHIKLESTSIIKRLISQMIKQFSEGKIELQIDTYPWEEVELFLLVFDNFFKELEVIGNSKIQPNDWSDIINMVYVSKGDKYSTNEKTWKRIILSDKRIAHYLQLFEYQKK